MKDGQRLFEENKRTPVSLRIENVLEEPLNEVIPSQDRYRECFNRFEYLAGLVYADIVRSTYKNNSFRGPDGCFVYSSRIRNIVECEIDEEGKEWAPLQDGLFGADLDRLKHVKEKYDRFLDKTRYR
jgi:hypothetical protein